MPKVSRVNKIRTRPGDASSARDMRDAFMCTRCGKTYKHQRGNFSASQSPINKSNGGYLTVCNRCVDELLDHYRETIGDEKAALRRICMKLDIYWNPELYGLLNKINTSSSRIRQYISKTFLVRYLGKTFDDTLDEEGGALIVFPDESVVVDATTGARDQSDIDADTILFWGGGFSEDVYRELKLRYARWTDELPKPLTKAEEALYRQVCLQEVQINRNIASGKSIEQGQNALNNLLSSLNVKPNQLTSDQDSAHELDETPLGIWAKRWEEMRPIPDDDPEMEDAHGLMKYISVWFYGHLCKALGLKNTYSQLYEQEIAKFRVEKPEFESDDDEAIIADAFGDPGGDGG